MRKTHGEFMLFN